jgi:glycine oxidase
MTGRIQTMGTCDVLVVGNGVLGLSVGLVLARNGARVVVSGAPHRPDGATPASGAMLGCFGEVTPNLLGSSYGRRKLELAKEARTRWPQWIESLESPDEDSNAITTAKDTVILLNAYGASALDGRNFAAIEKALDASHEPYEEVDVGDLRWLDPAPDCPPLRALYLPNEGAVNSSRLLLALEESLARLGGVMCSQEVIGLDHPDGRMTGATLEDGTSISAGRVVLASGARTQKLVDTIPELAARVPRVYGGYGVSIVLSTASTIAAEPPPSVFRTPNRSFACGLHVVPRGTGSVYVGATNDIRLEAGQGPAVKDVMSLLDSVTQQLRGTLSLATIQRVQAGYRPISIDGFPLLGETSVDGLWILTGTYRDGLHLSPLLAEHFGRRLLGQDGVCDVDLFKPDREPIQAFTREEIVADAARHMIAMGFEHRWSFKPELPLDDMLEHFYARLADELSDVYTPPSEYFPLLSLHPLMQSELRDYYTDVYKAWRSDG